MFESAVSDIKAPFSIHEILDNLVFDKIDLNFDSSEVIMKANKRLSCNKQFQISEDLDKKISQITSTQDEQFELNNEGIEDDQNEIDVSAKPRFSNLEVSHKPASQLKAKPLKVFRIHPKLNNECESEQIDTEMKNEKAFINHDEFKPKKHYKKTKVIINSEF